MKKNKIIAILMVMTLSCTLISCSNDNSNNKVETSIVETGAAESSTPDEYTIEDDQYNVKNVIIKHPRLKYSDENKTNMISALVESGGMLSTKYYDSQDKLNMNIKYKIKRKNKKIISVVFEGTGYVEGAAYANNHLYSVNVDLKNESLLKLSDFVDINEELAEKIKNGTVSDEQKEAFNALTSQDILNKLSAYDEVDSFNPDQSYSYLTDDSLGIILPVEHALGDYIQVEIPLSEVQLKMEIE